MTGSSLHGLMWQNRRICEMYLLDTNICIYAMKNMYPNLTNRLFSHDPSELFISSITVLELEYGAAKSRR